MSQLLSIEPTRLGVASDERGEQKRIYLNASWNEIERLLNVMRDGREITFALTATVDDGSPTAEEELRARVAELEAELTEGRGHLERVLNGATTDQTQAASRWLISDEVEF